MTEHGKASGFFTEVDLPAMGITVRIRKVDTQVLTTASTGSILAGAHAQVGAENAAEGGVLLRSLMDDTQRPDDATLQDAAILIQVSQAANRRMVQQAVKSPSYPDLLALYESDGADDDMGMGSDYTVLLNAIREHSGIKAVTPVEKASAERFPAGSGNNAGRGGKAVRKNTPGTPAATP